MANTFGHDQPDDNAATESGYSQQKNESQTCSSLVHGVIMQLAIALVSTRFLGGKGRVGDVCALSEFGANLRNDLLAEKVFGSETGSEGGGLSPQLSASRNSGGGGLCRGFFGAKL